MSEVLFMRHPETLGNTAHLFSGRRNVELSDRGALQCARAVRALVDWRPDRILTSPLVRCRSIAFGAALCLGIEPEVEERLVEIDFGALQIAEPNSGFFFCEFTLNKLVEVIKYRILLGLEI